jgi:hypothetical protein
MVTVAASPCVQDPNARPKSRQCPRACLCATIWSFAIPCQDPKVQFSVGVPTVSEIRVSSLADFSGGAYHLPEAGLPPIGPSPEVGFPPEVGFLADPGGSPKAGLPSEAGRCHEARLARVAFMLAIGAPRPAGRRERRGFTTFCAIEGTAGLYNSWGASIQRQ